MPRRCIWETETEPGKGKPRGAGGVAVGEPRGDAGEEGRCDHDAAREKHRTLIGRATAARRLKGASGDLPKKMVVVCARINSRVGTSSVRVSNNQLLEKRRVLFISAPALELELLVLV